MKRNAATVLLAAVLLAVAIALGIANKLRTDRRARSLVESLNRSIPPNGNVIQEGPGAVSTSEPRPTEVIKQETAPRDRSPSSIHFDDLRTAVLAGDIAGVRLASRRNVEPEDAHVIHSLLNKIPTTTDEETSRWIKSYLAHLLSRAKGDEGSRLLLAAVMQEGLLPEADWCASVHELGNRRYSAARAHLDGIAFGDGKGDVYASTCALIQIEPVYYLQRTGRAISTSGGGKLWDYVAALERSAAVNGIDIAAAVPDLKSKFLDASTPWGYRTRIARALESYSRHLNSTTTRDWLIHQMNRIIALPQGQSPPAWDVSICRELLALLRESANSNPK